MAKQLKVALVLSAVDKMTRQIEQATSTSIRRLEDFQRRADRISSAAFSFGTQAIAAGTAALGSLAFPVREAANFETQMANVSTLIDTTAENMAEMQAQVLAIAQRTPVRIADLAGALYDVRSAGIDAADAMSVLEQSARLGVAGLGTTTESVNIMTSAINAFKEEGLSADQVANLIFQTVKAGKTNISQLSQAFGANAAVIQSAGVRLADYQAATAALTSVGIPASQAQNQIRSAVVQLQKPTADLTKIFKALGVATGTELLEQTGSLGATFMTIQDAAERMGVNLNSAYGSVEAAGAAISLAGATNQAYQSTLAAMIGGTDALSGAFSKQADTINAQFTVALNNAQSAMIDVGNALRPMATEVIQRFTEMATAVAGFVKENPALVANIAKGVAAFGALAIAVGSGALVVGSIAKAVSVYTGVAKGAIAATKGFTTVLGMMRGGQAAAGIAQSAGWVSKFGTALRFARVALLALGGAITGPVAAAIAAGAFIIYKYWNPISNFFVGLWKGLQSGLAPIQPMFTAIARAMTPVATAFTPIINAAKMVFRWFGRLFTQVEDTEGRALAFGERVGTAIAGIINTVTGLIAGIANLGANFYEAGQNIVKSITDGIRSGIQSAGETMAELAASIRSYLPFSPAKEGPLRDINRVRIVETIAETMKPAPMASAMKTAAAAVMATGLTISPLVEPVLAAGQLDGLQAAVTASVEAPEVVRARVLADVPTIRPAVDMPTLRPPVDPQVSVPTIRPDVARAAVVADSVRVSPTVEPARVRPVVDPVRITPTVDPARVVPTVADSTIAPAFDVPATIPAPAPAVVSPRIIPEVAPAVASVTANPVNITPSVDPTRVVPTVDPAVVSAQVVNPTITPSVAPAPELAASITADPVRIAPTVDPARVTPSVDPVAFSPTVDPVRITPTVDPARVVPEVSAVNITPTVDPAVVRPTVQAPDVAIEAAAAPVQVPASASPVQVQGFAEPVSIRPSVDAVRITPSVDPAVVRPSVVNPTITLNVQAPAVSTASAPAPNFAPVGLSAPQPISPTAPAQTEAERPSLNTYSGGSTTLNYSPTVTINAAEGGTVPEELQAVLDQHKAEIMRILAQQQRNQNRVRF